MTPGPYHQIEAEPKDLGTGLTEVVGAHDTGAVGRPGA